MSSQVAFFTTIFPMERSYLIDFFNSLQRQTYQQFDVIVINDGYKEFSKIKKIFSMLNIIELNFSGSPAKNREHGINYIIENEYEVLIFGDSDDYFEESRVQVSLRYLRDYDILVNDVSLFDVNEVYSKKYISNRLKNNTEIDLKFIKDKNIFGLTNTSLNVCILDSVNFDEHLVAVDWYLFTKLLMQCKKAIFTNETISFYRQYAGSNIGLGIRNIEVVKKNTFVKSAHYNLLQDESGVFKALNLSIQNLINSNQYSKLLNHKVNYPLWWED